MNTFEDKKSKVNLKIGSELAQRNSTEPILKKTTRLGKGHPDYWKSRLEKRCYAHAGQNVQIPEWQVRIHYLGRREYFNLQTENKAIAATQARDVYAHLVSNGWEATLARYKAKGEARIVLTVGDYLKAVESLGALRLRTFLNYQNCFRTIVSQVFGVASDRSKFDYKGEGHSKWLERIDAIRLARLTPERVTQWQRRYVAKAGPSPVATASTKRTCNSYIRCARCLFSPELLKQLKGITLPARLPFEGVQLFESGSMRYTSRINVQLLIADAGRELKASDPEAYKAFVLALFAGLRKGEVDLLEWAKMDFENAIIRLEETAWLHLKTSDSAGAIALDREVMNELQAFMPVAKSEFVIASDRPPRNDSARPYYRCQPVFDRLNAWLRGRGITANKPLHELRKELGALIATEHGIYAASKFLRHSDITTTARHYADQKGRINLGMGKYLAPELKVVGEGNS